MKFILRHLIPSLITLLILSVSCSPKSPSLTETPLGEIAVVESQSGMTSTVTPGVQASQAETWVQSTLTLRSVTMEMESLYADGTSNPVLVQVDAGGNIHLTMPLSLPEEAATTPNLVSPGEFELFILGDQAYTRISEDSPAQPDQAYRTMLEDLLLGPEGPGFWLAHFQEENFQIQGSETYGGFAATRYSVDGPVGDGRVSGTIWIDDVTSALVGADLIIPGMVFLPPDSGFSGDVRLTLRVEQAEIPTVTIP